MSSRHTTESTRRTALAGAMLLLGTAGAPAQEIQAAPPAALRFFLTEAPPASVLSELPSFARRAFVARVRLLSIRSTHPPEWPPGEDVPDLPYGLRADLEVTEAIAGAYVWRRRQRVEFGSTRPSPTRVLYPLRRNIEYFVVSFVDQDGYRTLLGFPGSREELEAWRRELDQYAR